MLPANSPDVRALPLAQVHPNPKQPRTVFEPGALDELAASILARGLLQPIRVRQEGPERFVIVCGERRWRAHQRLGLGTILAVVVTELSDDDLADAAIVENMHRRDITPLEEARAFQARLDTGLTVDELAKRLGMKQAHRISERTALLRLRPEYQDALARGILTPSQATEMSRLGPTMQTRLFDAIGAGRCKTYAELRKVAGALYDAERQSDMFPADVPPTKEDVATATRLEKKIDAVCSLVASGFEDNEVVILRRVRPLEARVLSEKLSLIEQAMKQLRLSLLAADVAA